MTSSLSSPSPSTPSSLRRLIDETSDIIDSPAFTSVLTRLLDAAFSHLIDVKLSTLSYKIPPVSASSARVTEIVGDGVKAKVASSLAVFCRQAHSIGSGVGNEYLEKMEQVGELEAFAAVVYSSNFEFESPVLSGEAGVGVGETGAGGAAGAVATGQKEKEEEKEAEVRAAPLDDALQKAQHAVETVGAVVRDKADKLEDGFESAWGKATAAATPSAVDTETIAQAVAQIDTEAKPQTQTG